MAFKSDETAPQYHQAFYHYGTIKMFAGVFGSQYITNEPKEDIKLHGKDEHISKWHLLNILYTIYGMLF